MFKIRYNKNSGLLTGWGNDVKARNNTEAIVTLVGNKPDNDDYENYRYTGSKLAPSGKISPRNLAKELDELKEKVAKLEKL